ncbi:MAG: hypothetical protein ABIS06_16110 [Vicinamibacterales bacterium]
MTWLNLKHRRPRRCCIAALTLSAAALTVTVPAASTRECYPATSIDTLEEPSLQQYRAYRRMHAYSEKLHQEGWLEAWTELDGRTFRYQIVSERGSETVRNRVLRALLKREQEIIALDDPNRAELSASNYSFAEQTTGPGVRYVNIKPKRRDALLVDGRMVLSEDGRELLRVEGVLSKNPSFWTSLVNVIRHYARLDGVRVPIATESIAKVKIAGTSRLSVEYEYESINGRPVSTAARSLVASR